MANVKRYEVEEARIKARPESSRRRLRRSTTAVTIVLQQFSTQESCRCGGKLGDKGKELRVAVVADAVALYITAVLINGRGLGWMVIHLV